jgi:type IV pilus assembly protein PilE
MKFASLEKGFTLIEVMIVVAIVAIISAIALPSYDESVKRGKRSDGKAYLLDLASQQETFYAQNLSYANSITAPSELNTSATSTESHYTLALLALPAGCSSAGVKCRTFTLTATPVFTDDVCTTLTYNNSGTKGYTGTGGTVNDCWR